MISWFTILLNVRLWAIDGAAAGFLIGRTEAGSIGVAAGLLSKLDNQCTALGYRWCCCWFPYRKYWSCFCRRCCWIVRSIGESLPDLGYRWCCCRFPYRNNWSCFYERCCWIVGPIGESYSCWIKSRAVPF